MGWSVMTEKVSRGIRAVFLELASLVFAPRFYCLACGTRHG